MNRINRFLILFPLLSLIGLASCKKGGELPPIPNDGVTNSGDLKPDPSAPTPTPPPLPGDPGNPDQPSDPGDPNPQTVNVKILPSDIDPNSVALVYRKFIKPMQLGEVTKDEDDCHPSLPHKCIWNSQVIFGYDTEYLNKDFPKELWEITNVEITASFYSLAPNKRGELFCSLDLKICSGEYTRDAVTDDNSEHKQLKFFIKNPKFWVGRNKDHIVNDIFTQLLKLNQIEDHLWIVRDHTFDFGKLFNLKLNDVRTLLRKTRILSFSVSDDTYVEDPIVKVYLNRRLPTN